MARTSLQDFSQLLDPLLQFNFELLIANVPGVNNYNARDFRTKIMSTSIPGRTIESVQVDLKGMTKEFPGRTQYSRQLQFEMLETRDVESRRVLREWHQFIRDDSSKGAYESQYATTADLLLYDENDRVVKTIRLYKCWLESFDDSALDGSASSTVTISGSLKYAYHRDI